MKGDAKSCFDAIKEGRSTAARPIQLVICDVVDYKNFFVICNFNWVRRELNFAVHCRAKFVAIHRSFVCCN